jgi:hypothetical protein
MLWEDKEGLGNKINKWYETLEKSNLKTRWQKCSFENQQRR